MGFGIRFLGAVAIGALLSTAALAKPCEPRDKENRYDAGPVQLHIVKSDPPALLIQAKATARATEWSDAVLRPVEYYVPPADGMWEFHWDAQTIQKHGDQTVTVRAAYLWEDYPKKDVKGIRVCGSRNFTEAWLDGSTLVIENPKNPFDLGEIPFPW
jgi:hypothetical protein